METAFVDESIRRPSYILAVVSIESRHVQRARVAVGAAAPTGSRRTHLSAEGPARRERILAAYDDLAPSIQAAIFVTPYEGGDDQPARDRCLTALLESIVERDRCGRVVFDSRGPERDRVDRRLLATKLRGADRSVGYDHLSSREEPLISLPDAVAWTWGRGSMHLLPNLRHTVTRVGP